MTLQGAGQRRVGSWCVSYTQALTDLPVAPSLMSPLDLAQSFEVCLPTSGISPLSLNRKSKIQLWDNAAEFGSWSFFLGLALWSGQGGSTEDRFWYFSPSDSGCK